jgi:acetolactate synthase I/II/III large subunit
MDDRSVADAVVASWCDAGVEVAFGLDDPQPLFRALRESPIRTVLVHDERAGAFAADGFGRAAGRPAVCAGLTGPGATNLLTGLLEAHAARSPVVAVVGESTGRATRPAFQQAAHAEMLGTAAKAVVRVDGQAPGASARFAAELAVAGVARPVVFLADAAGLSAVAPDESAGVGAEVARPSAGDRVLRDAAASLAGAQRPVIVAGNGVHLSGAYEALRSVAEAFGVPVATTLLGKGALAEDHPLSVGVVSAYTGGETGHGRLANGYCSDADVLLVVGTDLDSVTTSNERWPGPDTRLIRIDLDEQTLLHFGGLAIQADARLALERLAELAPDSMGTRPAVVEMTEAFRKRVVELEELDAAAGDADGVWPATLIRELRTQMSGADALVTDASYSSAWVLDRFRQTVPGRQVFAPRGAGTLGWGLPAAIGVQLARPESKVVCVVGDGGLLYHVAELETIVSEGLPIAVFLLDNRCYGFQRHSDLLKQGVDHQDLRIRAVDWAALAQGTGCDYRQVTGHDELPDAIAAALSSDRPILVDVSVDEWVRPPIAMFDPEAAITH